ncbi:RmlC-like cupin domain-containing protein [Hysterangium stoloniferum]|nr:RmlC-like cupin domain-containing protein [Hysterangium stoloniferum]
MSQGLQLTPLFHQFNMDPGLPDTQHESTTQDNVSDDVLEASEVDTGDFPGDDTDLQVPDSEDDGSDEELSDDDEVEDPQKPYEPVPLPMPNFSEFFVPLPAELQTNTEDEEPLPPTLSEPPRMIHVPDLLKEMDPNDLPSFSSGIQVVHIGRETGLTGEMQATYLRLPPGTRTTRPVAQRLGDVVTYCISGRGLLWQNGWTFPFNATDAVGWKGGTGTTHTIINDSNSDGSQGEDLVLITAQEVKQGELFYYPLDQEVKADIENQLLWMDPPPQGESGPHPGTPSISLEGGKTSLPDPVLAYRPSNVINTIAELDAIGEGEMFANATSITQETGLSGRFGCNFEVPPPGARSSEPHAHSLEDELVYIVSGNGIVWINGHVEQVREGDAVGFPGGTGIAHNFINDSNTDGKEGDPLMLWIIGQNRAREGDLVYYPLKASQPITSKRWWTNCPKYVLGPHDGHATHPLDA